MIPIVKFLMFITYPIVKPIAFMLDKILGHHEDPNYHRNDLKMFVRVHQTQKGEKGANDEHPTKEG